MFHIVWNGIISETALLGKAVEGLQKRLPPNWMLGHRQDLQNSLPGKEHFDAILEIRDPHGSTATIIVETKAKPIEARQVISILANWQRTLTAQASASPMGNGERVLMAVAPYLGPSTRERLSASGISYADLTGNFKLVINSPAVFIEVQGANRNPWREDRPLRSLKGSRAARAVRGFLDYQTPFGIRELASGTGSSAATISRVSDLLERDAIVSRESPRGPICSVNWEGLVRRWAMDYSFLNHNKVMPWIEPRGTGVLFDRLRNTQFPYAVTGSFAAIRFAPVVQPRLVALYAADPEEAANELGLRPAGTGGNVLMGRPFDPVVFERTEVNAGITYARITQVLADLLTGPGRGSAEAERLFDYMRVNEDSWKISLA